MFLIYLPDGTNVYGARSVQGVESCKMMFLGGSSHSLFEILLLYDVSFSHNTQHHRQTDRQAIVWCQ